MFERLGLVELVIRPEPFARSLTKLSLATNPLTTAFERHRGGLESEAFLKPTALRSLDTSLVSRIWGRMGDQFGRFILTGLPCRPKNKDL